MNSMYFGDRSHLHRLLQEGKSAWNEWREKNWKVRADLSNCPLHEAELSYIDFSSALLIGTDLMGANLSSANLSSAKLLSANLSGADLSYADLRGADLSSAILDGADLTGADLSNAYLWDASLEGANLSYANLEGAILLETNVRDARITNSHVYGVNVWSLRGDFKEQKDLIITPMEQTGSQITIDNIKIAQFIYLILNHGEVREVINTFTSKAVLILGRFTGEGRKETLDALRDKLRENNLLPIVFDFDRPAHRDYTETVQTLAGLSLFVIVDVTLPRSTPLEMEATVKQFKVPYLPIIDLSADPHPFAMMEDLQKSFHWVLPTFGYHSKKELLENVEEAVIRRALEKHNNLKDQKDAKPRILTLEDLKKSGKGS